MTEALRAGPAADTQRMDLAGGLAGSDGRTDLQHVGAEHLHALRLKVVGVILHEGSAAGQAGAHHLHGAQQGGRLPVALGAEAVATGHQALHGDAGQLRQAVQVFESVGKGVEAAVLQKGAQAQLEAGGLAQSGALTAVLAQAAGQDVFVFVRFHQLVHFPVAHLLDKGCQIAQPVAVDGVAKLDLGAHLVALRDGHLPHVVAEASHLQGLRVAPGTGRPRPAADLLLHRRRLPVAGHHLALAPQPRIDETELAPPVGRLVEVHEVHVDLAPGDVPVELGVQMQQRLLQLPQPGDPHPGRREGVHPGDEAGAAPVEVGLQTKTRDGLRRRQHRLQHDVDRNGGGRAKPGRHRAGMGGHLPQNFFAVKVLTAGDEPELVVG